MDVEVTDVALGPSRARLTVPMQPNGAAVLLYPTIFGVTAWLGAFAEELAQLGLTVVAWDPYRGEPVSDSVMEMVRRSASCQDEAAMEDVTLIVDHLRSSLGVGEVAGLGWCFGGRIGLVHAGVDPRITLLCSYNPTMLSVTPVDVPGIGTTSRADQPGQTMDELALARDIVGPVQVTRPQHDFTQPAEYASLATALFERDDPTFYEYYPGAGHGFSYTPGEANQRAQTLAWSRTRSLLCGLGDDPR
jgi:carboxymethylenebutenolidase